MFDEKQQLFNKLKDQGLFWSYAADAGLKNCDYLLDSTQAVLHRLVSSAPFLHNYVFVGGSATALHLRHRLSEDLDFFTWDSSLFDVRQIQAYLVDWPNKQVLNISEQQITHTELDLVLKP